MRAQLEGFSTPSYLRPVSPLIEGSRVTRVPDEPEAYEDGSPKQNSAFPGCSQWKLQVKVLSAVDVFDGQEEPEYARISVSVWLSSRPRVRVGQHARFTGLMAGAVDGTVFFQARGVEAVETAGEVDIDA